MSEPGGTARHLPLGGYEQAVGDNLQAQPTANAGARPALERRRLLSPCRQAIALRDPAALTAGVAVLGTLFALTSLLFDLRRTRFH
jgi:hypothetical protein